MNLPQPEMIKKNKNFCLSLSRSHTKITTLLIFATASCSLQMASTTSMPVITVYAPVSSLKTNVCCIFFSFFCKLQRTLTLAR